MRVSYAFMYLVAVELELDISVVAFVNHAAFIEVSYIYVCVCRLSPRSYGVICTSVKRHSSSGENYLPIFTAPHLRKEQS